MRIAPLSVLISASFFVSSVFAQDTTTVNTIESEINTKQTEYARSTTMLDKYLKEETQLQTQLELLRTRLTQLDKEKNQALDAMNDVYRRLVDNPSLDITPAQSRYQKAVVDHEQNKNDISMQLAAIASHRKDIEQIRAAKHTLQNTIETLKTQYTTARVERLRNEFTREGTLEVNHIVSCKRTETLAACEQSGQQMGLKIATKRFIDQVFENLTEKKLVEPKRDMSGAQVQILSSHVINSAFSGQGDYNVNLSVTMRGDVNSSRLCHLLSVNNSFCSEYGTPLATTYQPVYGATFSDSQLSFSENTDNNRVEIVDKPVNEKPKAVADKKQDKLIQLTLRSNVYGDEVFINDIHVGSTRLVTSLPRGLHKLEIRKDGYIPYKARIDLKTTRTLFAKLKKKSESIAVPTKKREQIIQADCPKGMEIDTKAPSVDPTALIIPAGSFKMGDINGNGLENERPVVEKIISDSFVMQSKEVTVGAFEIFVNETQYKTEAEKNQGCAYYLNGEPVWEAKLNWRNPGFEQTDEFPAVCLSQNDAKAYADWFSEKTAQVYRLPTEVEWEYAARAGSETEYPWGNEIGKNLANCGWCGSEWSNKRTAPVGFFSANEFGLYDTVGNVWEWTLSQSDNKDAVVRGGAWNFAPSLARASTRLVIAPDFRSNYIGFRLMSEQE